MDPSRGRRRRFARAPAERAVDGEPGEPGLSFLRDQRRREKAGAARDSARPRPVSQETRHARTDERAELAMLIESRAPRYRKPARDIDVVLHEDARHREAVRELRQLDRLKMIAFDRRSTNERVFAESAPSRHFREAGVAIVAFRNLAVCMMLSPATSGSAHAPHHAARGQRLERRAGIGPTRVGALRRADFRLTTETCPASNRP